MTHPYNQGAETLLPCPFCGFEAAIESNAICYWVECKGCCIKGHNWADPKTGVDEWNRRPIAPQAVPTAPEESSTEGPKIPPCIPCLTGHHDDCTKRLCKCPCTAPRGEAPAEPSKGEASPAGVEVVLKGLQDLIKQVETAQRSDYWISPDTLLPRLKAVAALGALEGAGKGPKAPEGPRP